MAIVRIVLAVEQPLLANALRTQFVGHEDLRVEAQVSDELAAALALRQLLLGQPVSADDRVVVILFIADEGAATAACARLIIEFPEVIVVTINAASGKIRSHRGSIKVMELQGSLDNLVQELRALLTAPDYGGDSS